LLDIKATSGAASQSLPTTALGLTPHASCNPAGVSEFYLGDATSSGTYHVTAFTNADLRGSVTMTVHNGGIADQGVLNGLGRVEGTYASGSVTEYVLQYNGSGDGLATADLTVTRSGKSLVVHVQLEQDAGGCSVQAWVTPTV
jgi:hypothetical protein